MGATILLVDDEEVLRRSLATYLKRAGYGVVEAASGEDALILFERHAVDVAAVDLRLPGIDGLAVLAALKEREPAVPVVMMTACEDIPPAVEAIKRGAYDYLKKPFDPEDLVRVVGNAFQTYRLRRELAVAEEGQSRHYRYLVFRSRAMRDVLALVDRLARTPHTPALIVGETGTGKEVVAREIHARSARAAKPFVTVNCSALPETLIESELFGYVRGAFTGAVKDKRGLFEFADGGTIFLDEIGDMKPSLQPTLLRVLEEKAVRRVGGAADVPVDVRVIAATNRDLVGAVRQGLFREDLFFRLNVFTITVPPLRDRREDILPVAEYFREVFNVEFKKNVEDFAADAHARLESYGWPGNVRELRNVVERAVILAEGRRVTVGGLAVPTAAPPEEGTGEAGDLSLVAEERRHVKKVLSFAGGNKVKAAALLGISRTTLWSKIKQYRLE